MKAAYHPTNKQPLATNDDFARMQHVLERHSKRNQAGTAPKPYDADIEAPVASGSLPNTLAADGAGSYLPVSSPLEWEPLLPGKRGYYDTTHRYSCSSITIAGHKYFEASKLAGGGCWYYPLAQRLKSWAETEKRCQADFTMYPP